MQCDLNFPSDGLRLALFLSEERVRCSLPPLRLTISPVIKQIYNAHSAVPQGIQQMIYYQCDHIHTMLKYNFKNGLRRITLAGQFTGRQYAVIMFWANSLLHKLHCYRTVFNWLLHRLISVLFSSERQILACILTQRLVTCVLCITVHQTIYTQLVVMAHCFNVTAVLGHQYVSDKNCVFLVKTYLRSIEVGMRVHFSSEFQYVSYHMHMWSLPTLSHLMAHQWFNDIYAMIP